MQQKQWCVAYSSQQSHKHLRDKEASAERERLTKDMLIGASKAADISGGPAHVEPD